MPWLKEDTLAVHALSAHFNYFFHRLNPSPTFERQATSEHASIVGLLEDRGGLTAALAPQCFLQGSYRQQTAIHTINDVDIVALCRLWHPSSGSGGELWNRDRIFATIAAPLLADWRYRDKVRYTPTSMCVKIDLGIKVEILPVVYTLGNNDPNVEPFQLYRPQRGQWEESYARYHQAWLSYKNRPEKTGGNFIPAVKVVKHLRSLYSNAISFHIESLLYTLPDELFRGGPADYIASVLEYIAAIPPGPWYARELRTPVGERDIFTSTEWGHDNWMEFHRVVKLWASVATRARDSTNRGIAVEYWQMILGKGFFPTEVAL